MHVNAPRAEPLKAKDLNRLSFISEVNKGPEVWSNPIDHPVWDVRDVEVGEPQAYQRPRGLRCVWPCEGLPLEF